MFVRPSWKPFSDEEIYQFLETYPWALLINNGKVGPFATNMPLLLDRSDRDKGRLIGHIATANPHADALFHASEPTLAIFEGPFSYVTASWYPQRDMPSTYYYTAVHCYGHIRRQSREQLREWLETLTRKSEAAYPGGWQTKEIEESAITRRLDYIIGFELEIERLEGKFKLGQDEPRKDALAVAETLSQRSDSSERILGEMVYRYNVGRPK